LAAECKAIFILSRIWTATGLLNESEVDYALIKENGSRDKACNDTDICISIPVWLASLTMHIEGLIDGRG
jgi:hypothetical protein